VCTHTYTAHWESDWGAELKAFRNIKGISHIKKCIKYSLLATSNKNISTNIRNFQYCCRIRRAPRPPSPCNLVPKAAMWLLHFCLIEKLWQAERKVQDNAQKYATFLFAFKQLFTITSIDHIGGKYGLV